MARLTGILLVAAAAAGYAYFGFAALDERLKELRKMMRALIYISSGVGCMQPLESIFLHLSKTEGSLFDVFSADKSAEEIWRECVDKTTLNTAEKNMFYPLGGCLGGADKTAQLKTIEMILKNAEVTERELEREIKKYLSENMKLRLTMGIMVIILFI